MYSKIICPKNFKTYELNSAYGRKILKNYLLFISKGGDYSKVDYSTNVPETFGNCASHSKTNAPETYTNLNGAGYGKVDYSTNVPETFGNCGSHSKTNAPETYTNLNGAGYGKVDYSTNAPETFDNSQSASYETFTNSKTIPPIRFL